MNHKNKIKLARRLFGGKIKHEITVGKGDKEKTVRVKTALFNNPVWNERSKAIAARVKRKQDAAHARAVERKSKK